MRRVQIIGALCLAAVACLVGAVSASADPSDPFQYKFSFGEDLNVTFGQIAVNHETGNVLVMGGGGVHQFDADGNPAEFAALGSSQIGHGGQLALDNSGGPTQGNFYLWDGTFLRTYHPDGSPIGVGLLGPGEFWPEFEGYFSNQNPITTLSVGPDGTLWAFTKTQAPGDCIYCDIGPVGLTPEVVPIGSGSAYIKYSLSTGFISPVFDQNGYLYSAIGNTAVAAVEKYDSNNGFAPLGRNGLSNVGPEVRQLAVDPSNDDVYLAVDLSDAPGVPRAGSVTAAHPDSTEGSAPLEVLSAAYGLEKAGGIGFDSTGQTLYLSEGGKVAVFHREAPSSPWGVTAPVVARVRSVDVSLQAELTDGGAGATYHFEYGTTTSYGASTAEVGSPRNYFPVKVSRTLPGLEPDTTYHVRLVAHNAAGTTYGPDREFKTYRGPEDGADPCPNALARKQTIAQRLPDCRAFELVSAPDTGGYDVESDLAPGQSPFPGFPLAKDRLLYATHSGAVPGPWNATNKGSDPYVATRTGDGWKTQYEGLPSDLNPQAGSFASVLGEADSSLSTLAFAGPNLCSPCFTDGGLETGIPVRMPNGRLVQGMSGSLVASVPATARPEGKVAKYFSGNGKKLLFASKYAFEPGANGQNGSLTVYERDLTVGTTEIVSTDPVGNALTGAGISELDVSSDGSRVAIGTKVSEDTQGNEYLHPYLHLAGTPGSVDLAPGTTSGVLYAGMTEDGSKLFFTSPDKLTAEDTDESADLYEADVDSAGNLALKLITPDSGASCSPVANEEGAHWNSTTGVADCSAVAISGGGGVASSTGAVYFLSPESFGGQGSPDQPNLYLAQPSGQISLVATIEPGNPLVLDSVKAATSRRTGDFQTTRSGNYAAFVSKLPMGDSRTRGFTSAYRFDASAGQLDCISCDRTGTDEAGVLGAAELPPNGLGLLENGRVFFTTPAQLLLNDANGMKDVYEWSDGRPWLVSAGTGPFDSALLTVSADGSDVFFFTHDDLAPEEDRNGAQVRIYDAREGGGYFRVPASVPCQASDECHGPSSPQPGPADIKSSGKTTQGNVVICGKNRVKKRGQCVKKAHAKKHHNKKHTKKRKGAKKRAASTNGKRGGRNA